MSRCAALFLKKSLLNIRIIIPLLFLFSFFFLTLSYFFSTHVWFNFLPYDVKRVLQLFFLVLFNSYFLIIPAYRRETILILSSFSRITKLSLLIIFIIGVISSAVSQYPLYAFLLLSLYFLLFSTAIHLAVIYKIFPDFTQRAFFAVIFFSVLIYLINFVLIAKLHSGHGLTFFPGFMNVRFFAQYQAWTLPLVLYPLFTVRHRLLRCIAYFISLAWFCLLLVNFPKGLLLAYMLSLLIVFIISHQRKIVLKIHLELVGGLLFMLVLFLVYMLLSGHTTEWLSTASHYFYSLMFIKSDIYSRGNLFYQAMLLMLRHPLFGVGPMHFSSVYNGIAAHPHNSLLLFGSEWGMIALLLLILLIINGFKRGFSLANKSNNPLSLLLMMSILVAFLYSLVSGVFVTPLSQIMFSLVFGWMLAIQLSSTLEMNSSCLIRDEIFWGLLVASGVIFLIVFIAPRLSHLSQNEIFWYLHNPYHLKEFLPRFWIQGMIG